MSTQFQPYLESICVTYAQWWNLYTLTDAEGRQRQSSPTQTVPIFDFGLMVQTVAQEERGAREEDAREKEQVERFSVLEGLRKYVAPEQTSPQVLLVGRPGSGKSTALARLLLEEATTLKKSQFLKNCDFLQIPVLVELRYWQGSIDQLILKALARHGLSLRLEQLEPVLAQSLLLFDGVNELPSEVARSQLIAFRRDHPQVPMIFTTRDLSLGGDLGIEHRLEMQPLTEAQMQAFVRAYVPEQAEALLRQLKDRLRELGQTPLLLWMLCEVIQQTPDDQLPSNLAGVFQAFTFMYEQSSVLQHKVAMLKGDVKPLSDRRLWKKALKMLAFLMMQGETPVDFRVVIHRDEAERELSKLFPNEQFPVRDILDDLLKYHLLQNRTIDQIEFRHQLLQEYYAAEALLERLPDLSDGELQREYLNYLKWTEPVALMLALVGNEQLALRVVEQSLTVDWMLGARLVKELPLPTDTNITALEHEILREMISGTGQLKRPRHKIDLIARQRLPKRFKEKLLDSTLSCPTENVSSHSDFEEMDTEKNVDDLVSILETTGDPVDFLIAVGDLGDLRSEKAIPTMLKFLKIEDSNLQWAIKEALIQIGGEGSSGVKVISKTNQKSRLIASPESYQS